MIRVEAPPPVHTLFEVAAFLVGFRFFLHLRKRQEDPLPERNRLWIVVGAAAGALVGSRLLGALEHPDWLDGAPILAALQRRTIVGGLLGGLAGVELAKRLLGETRRSGDLFVFPLLLGLMIGRVGCFLTSLADHTAGRPTALPWGLDFGDGIPRHPLMLYEIAFLAFFWAGLAALRRRVELDRGGLFRLFMAGYLLFRLAVESLKPDWVWPWGLTAIQTACVAGLVYYHRVVLRPRSLVAHA